MARIRTAALIATATLALPLPAHAACRVQSFELPVTMVGPRAVATVGINGTPVPLTVDSGASFSMLTDAAAAQLKLPLRWYPGPQVEGIAGAAETRATTVERLELLKTEFRDVEFVVGGNEPGAGTMGLMGRNILSSMDTEYDLGHGAIRFLTPDHDCDERNMAYWAGSSPVTELDVIPDYRSKRPAIRARGKLNGHELIVLFDTGAASIVSTSAARRAGVGEAAWTHAGFAYGVGRGRLQVWTAPFESFELGSEAIRDLRLRLADLALRDADMLLGIDFFLSHRLYVSKKRSKVWITYDGGPVFALGERTDATQVDAGPLADDDRAATAEQLARRGAAATARRDFEGALADLDRACALEPTNAAFLAQRGVVQWALKRPAKALGDFDRAIALDPAAVDARFRRASLRYAERDRDGAQADLDALDQTLAPQAQMRLAMSQLYLRLEQPARALEQLNLWLPAHPHEVRRDVAQNARCRARVLLGIELEQALRDCDDAMDADPKNAAHLDSRGWAYLCLGEYRKAMADFDRSLQVDPKVASSLFGRGVAEARLGDVAQGEADRTAAHALRPGVEPGVERVGARCF